MQDPCCAKYVGPLARLLQGGLYSFKAIDNDTPPRGCCHNRPTPNHALPASTNQFRSSLVQLNLPFSRSLRQVVARSGVWLMRDVCWLAVEHAISLNQPWTVQACECGLCVQVGAAATRQASGWVDVFAGVGLGPAVPEWRRQH